MPLPTFFIIGAPKAGTTSLHYYLDQHPDIGMSSTKEPHFFVDPISLPSYLVHHVEDRHEYESLFPHGTSQRGEASPSYTEYPRYTGVPARIRSVLPDAKFIYLVRDPIDRTISHYMHHVAVDGERRSLADALGDCSEISSPYLCPSLYATQLEQYLLHFAAEQILVIDQSDLLNRRLDILKEVFRFLSVDDTFVSQKFTEVLLESRDRRVYPQRYMKLVRRVTRSYLRKLPRGLRRGARQLVERQFSPMVPRPSLDRRQSEVLRELYGPDVERLRRLTGKDFATWTI